MQKPGFVSGVLSFNVFLMISIFLVRVKYFILNKLIKRESQEYRNFIIILFFI